MDKVTADFSRVDKYVTTLGCNHKDALSSIFFEIEYYNSVLKRLNGMSDSIDSAIKVLYSHEFTKKYIIKDKFTDSEIDIFMNQVHRNKQDAHELATRKAKVENKSFQLTFLQKLYDLARVDTKLNPEDFYSKILNIIHVNNTSAGDSPETILYKILTMATYMSTKITNLPTYTLAEILRILNDISLN